MVRNSVPFWTKDGLIFIALYERIRLGIMGFGILVSRAENALCGDRVGGASE